MDPNNETLFYISGSIVGAGGIYGFLKSRSVVSLVAGSFLGGGYLLGGYYIANKNYQRGHEVALGTSALITGIMGSRFLRTKKIMPAGILTLLGLSCSGVSLYGFYKKPSS